MNAMSRISRTQYLRDTSRRPGEKSLNEHDRYVDGTVATHRQDMWTLFERDLN